MATVPYSSVPSVAVSGAGVSEVSPNVQAGAFGADVAHAISGVGKAIEGAGNEVYERAIWLQNQQNQADARQASADYTIAAGKLHADYNALEGKNAVDAYPKFTQNLKDLRSQFGGRLDSPMARQMYDNESLGTMSHAIFNGSSHAAGQQKAYIVGSMDADITSQFEQAARNPKDEIGFGKALTNVEATVRQKGRLQGLPPEAVDNSIAMVKSKFWASKFENQAKEEPFQAQSAMYENRENMTAADFKRTEALVGAQVHAVGSVNIANDYIKAHTDDDGNFTGSIDEAHKAIKDLATKMSPDDALFPAQAVKAFDSALNQDRYAKRVEKSEAIQGVNGAIVNGANSMQELLADPAGYAAYKNLPDSEKRKVPGMINNYVKARDYRDNQRAMTEITGLKNNDVEAFLNLNPTDESYKLSQAQIRQVQDMQAAVKKQTAQDPRVDRAMSWMRAGFGAQMEAMQVFRRTTANKADYDHLTGAVQQAIDLWQEDHKKPPTNKEFNEQIAPEILKVQKQPGMFGLYGGPFGSDRAIFQHDTSSKEYTSFAEQAKADIAAKGGSEPSDEEIYKAYTRVQLLKLYPAKTKALVVTDGK